MATGAKQRALGGGDGTPWASSAEASPTSTSDPPSARPKALLHSGSFSRLPGAVEAALPRWYTGRSFKLGILGVLTIFCLLHLHWAGEILPHAWRNTDVQPPYLERHNSTTYTVQIRGGGNKGVKQQTFVVDATVVSHQIDDGGTGGGSVHDLRDRLVAAAEGKETAAAASTLGSQPVAASGVSPSPALSPPSITLFSPLDTSPPPLEVKNKDAEEEEEKVEEKPRLALLRPWEVMAEGTDACAQSINMPKVAILILTKGDLFHEETWRLWFESAKGLISRSAVHDLACGGDELKFESAKAACQARYEQYIKPGADVNVIDQQRLFNVYIHAPPDVQDQDMYPLFRGRLVRDRVDPAWGSHQLVEATRYMLWEAFRDPLNTRFVMVSESDVPIVNPQVFYQQVMSEELSRINTCMGPRNDRRRWSWRMATANLRPSNWRKTSQWFMMTREHVRTVLDDTEVFRQFERHCWASWDGDYRRHRDCFSDEHYIPTLFSVLSMEQKGMDCEVWGVVSTDWSRGGPHPRSYEPEDVTEELFATKLRAPVDKCDVRSASATAVAMFAPLQTAFARTEDCDAPVQEYARMPPICKITARKFPIGTVETVRKVFTNCTSGLDLLDPQVCSKASPKPLSDRFVSSLMSLGDIISGNED